MMAILRSMTPFIAALFFIAICGPGTVEAFGAGISRGPEVILQPRPGSTVVCVAVAVRTGSALETPENRGVSHFLEHLCFDGSERFTRKEICDWTDRTGAFLNAFTRKETAVYFLLVDRAYTEESMEILSQMLLHSVFPLEEVEKERKVILEEIRQAADDPQQERDGFVERYLYRGSDLAEPVMGYPATIEGMTRADIIEHYKSHYLPERMKIFVFGGFEPERIRGWIDDYFGGAPGAHDAVAGDLDGTYGKTGRGREGGKKGPIGDPRNMSRYAGTPRWSAEVTVRSSDRFRAGIDVLVPVPGPGEKGFPAVLVLEEILGSEGSPLSAKLKESLLPEAQVSLEVHEGFSALRFHVDCGDSNHVSLSAVPSIMGTLSSWKPAPEQVDAAKTACLSAEALDREKFHLYIMLAGERLAFSGAGYLEESTSGVRDAGAEDIEKIISDGFDPLRFNAVQIVPVSVFPAAVGEPPAPVSKTLENGCRLAVSTRTGSSVAALHVLVSGRNCIERDFRNGMTAVMHSVLENSSAGSELSSRLRSMGASLQWGDNPYIPMDDYMLSGAWSFCRLEAPAGRLIEAAGLLAGHLSGSIVTDEDILEAGAVLGRELGVRSGSSSGILTGELMTRLFGDHPFSKSLFPRMGDLADITPKDLEQFRTASICGANLIVTVVSPDPAREVLDEIGRIFRRFPAGSASLCPSVTAPVIPGIHEGSIDKQGVYLGAGWRVSDPSPEQAASLMVASEILSRRMQLEIREIRGLAYSTGSAADIYPGAVAVMATVGTRVENLETATEALEVEISKLSSEPPTLAEIEIARNRLLSRVARRELSSINQASSMGLDILLRGGRSGERLIRMVTQTGVEDAITDVLQRGNAVFVKLVPDAGASEKKSIPAQMMRR